MSDLQVNMEIDNETEQVRLRGPRSAVYEAAIVLQSFVDANFLIELAADSEDEGTLLSGGENSLVRKLQDMFEIEIHVNRKLHIIRLRGYREKVEVAREHIVNVSLAKYFSTIVCF